ncbi:8642_t:CDS:2 [Entrophospora sp. SA101]|nr:8642_t:CDS:2 [Entrophospora sp. SA101]
MKYYGGDDNGDIDNIDIDTKGVSITNNYKIDGNFGLLFRKGYRGDRHSGGRISLLETCLDVYDLDGSKWSVNVQSLSGAIAILYVYYAILKPHECLMGLVLPHVHLMDIRLIQKKISAVSAYFKPVSCRLDEKTDRITKNLKLWKIDIADDPRHYFTEYYLGEIYDHRKEISTTGHVEDYWTDTPPKGNIHIIVEPPVQVIFIPVHGAPVVKIKPHNIEFKEMVGCEQTELKPVLYGLPDYDLYMYLDDTGLLKDLPRNALATCLLYGRKMDQVPGVRGHVVLYDSYKQLTLDDFRFILSTAQNLN